MEDQRLINDYETVTKQLLQLLDGLSEQELNTVPFEGSWTAGQLGDHLRQAYGITELPVEYHATERDPLQHETALHSIFDNDAEKYRSPEAILPADHYFDKARLIGEIRERAEALQTGMSDHGTEEVSAFDFPGLGALTGYEQLVLATVHTNRHNRQLETIIERLKNG